MSELSPSDIEEIKARPNALVNEATDLLVAIERAHPDVRGVVRLMQIIFEQNASIDSARAQAIEEAIRAAESALEHEATATPLNAIFWENQGVKKAAAAIRASSPLKTGGE